MQTMHLDADHASFFGYVRYEGGIGACGSGPRILDLQYMHLTVRQLFSRGVVCVVCGLDAGRLFPEALCVWCAGLMREDRFHARLSRYCTYVTYAYTSPAFRAQQFCGPSFDSPSVLVALGLVLISFRVAAPCFLPYPPIARVLLPCAFPCLKTLVLGTFYVRSHPVLNSSRRTPFPTQTPAVLLALILCQTASTPTRQPEKHDD